MLARHVIIGGFRNALDRCSRSVRTEMSAAGAPLESSFASVRVPVATNASGENWLMVVDPPNV